MQAKAIPDEIILNYLAERQGEWTAYFRMLPELMPEVPEKVFIAKMSGMIKRGLSGGCACGCRGDYEITDKGLAMIGRTRTAPYTGY